LDRKFVSKGEFITTRALTPPQPARGAQVFRPDGLLPPRQTISSLDKAALDKAAWDKTAWDKAAWDKTAWDKTAWDKTGLDKTASHKTALHETAPKRARRPYAAPRSIYVTAAKLVSRGGRLLPLVLAL
jgi:hypothetical protein